MVLKSRRSAVFSMALEAESLLFSICLSSGKHDLAKVINLLYRV
jgi:hypothetical protein